MAGSMSGVSHMINLAPASCAGAFVFCGALPRRGAFKATSRTPGRSCATEAQEDQALTGESPAGSRLPPSLSLIPTLIPLWAKSGHRGELKECPLYPQKRTSLRAVQRNRGVRVVPKADIARAQMVGAMVG